MEKKRLLKSTILLIVFGFVAKLLSVIAKVITTRIIGVQGMGYFALAAPVMILLFTLGQAGLPMAIAKLVSTNYQKRGRTIIAAFCFAIVLNVILLTLLIILAPYIANDVLKNPSTLPTIYILALLTPLTCISGMLKGYCMGVNRISITSFSQIVEELGRIIFITLCASFFTNLGPAYGSMGAMLGLVVGEICQSLTLIIGNLRSVKRNYQDFWFERKKLDSLIIKDILSVAVPVTSNRFLTSFTYFLEPIIMTSILLKAGLTSDQIAYDYALLSSYAMSLLLLPGFFATAFSTVLLPNMSEAIAKNKVKRAQKLFLALTFSSLCIGTVAATIFFSMPEFLLNLFYRNTEGAIYVKYLAFPFIIFYIEAPISSAMYALSMNKQSLLTCLIASVFRTVALYAFIPKLGMMGVAISTIVEVIVLVLLNLILVLRKLFGNNTQSINLINS